MARLHGDLGNASYDAFEDFHVTMQTDDLDAFASKFVADGVHVLARRNHNGGGGGGGPSAFSLFVELPHAIVVELTGPSLTVVTPQPWTRCGAPARPAHVDRPYAALVARSGAGVRTLQPRRAVYASTAPAEAARFVAIYFEGELVAPQPTSAAAVAAANGTTCYEMRTVRWSAPSSVGSPSDAAAPAVASSADAVFSSRATASPPPPPVAASYELTWIYSPRLRQGALTLHRYEEYLRALHGNLSVAPYDVYMDNHVAITFDDGDPVVARLQADGKPFFMRGQYGEFADVFIEGPGGQIYEVLARRQTRVKELPGWD
eukprot:3953850-Prymnesium_polylepis.1